MFLTTIPMFLKAATVVAVIITLGSTYKLWRAGRVLANYARLNGDYHPVLIAHHGQMIWWLVGGILSAVVCIETQVRLSPHPYAVNAWLFGVHLAMIATFCGILVAIVSRFTGKRNPRMHRILVYSMLTLFAGIAVTGSLLLYALWS